MLNVRIHNRPSIGGRTPPSISMLNETRGASVADVFFVLVLILLILLFLLVSLRNNTMVVSFSTIGFTDAHTQAIESSPMVYRATRRDAARRAVSRRSEADKIARVGYRLAYTRFTCLSPWTPLSRPFIYSFYLTSAPRAVDIAPRYGATTQRRLEPRRDDAYNVYIVMAHPCVRAHVSRVLPPFSRVIIFQLGFPDRPLPRPQYNAHALLRSRKVNGLT